MDEHFYYWLESMRGDDHPAPTPCIESQSTSAQKRKHEDMEDPSELTPVAKRRMFPIPSPSQSKGASDDAQSSVLSSNATRSRSSSPTKSSLTKRKRDLQFAWPRIIFHEGGLKGRRQELEQQIPLLRSLLSTVSQAQKELPANLKKFLHEHNDELSDTPLPPFVESAVLAPFDDIEPFIRNIVAETRFCQEMEATEEEWSHRVVYPTLSLAASKVRSGMPSVDIATVKTIDISPTTLLPTNYQGDKIQRKRVDYVVGTNLRRNYQPQAVRTTLEPLTGRTISQSDHPRVAEMVMFSHLEVKRQLSVRDGDIQLGIWCAAGMKKLEQLWWERHPEKPATAPLIVVQDQPPTMAVMPLWLWKDDAVVLYVAIKPSSDEIEILTVRQWSCAQEAELARLVVTLTWIVQWGCADYFEWWKGYLALHEILT